ncbi:hypothetical protein ABT297_15910 [Dactylosporangium sp. NPDC000555]|uniref:hypothetical protein n=1 Tax=Dactylosporangium sp. NPDC000555 TaxID=3154260 RepID=UPI0033260F65
MADFNDQFLASAFAEFRGEVEPHVKPAGTAAAHDTVHRRHRVRMITATALAALAVAAPVAAYAAVTGDPHGPPPAVTGDAPSDLPSATSSDPASLEPSVAPAVAGSAAPDGRISKADLSNATLNIPAWPKGFDEICPTGKVKFSGGKAGDRGLAALQGDPVYVDVDHDGALETVILISCSPQGSDYQVVALDRDTTGKIVTLGKVVGSAGNTGKEGSDIMTIWAIKAGDNGQVRVDVGEFRPCCEMAQASQHQWREYGWNGSRFTQTGGPAEFGPNPKVTDLVITADRLIMTKQSDGSWAGTLRVNIHNAAKVATPGKVWFGLSIDAGWQSQPGTDCPLNHDSPQNCTLPGIGAGADRSLTIRLTAPAGSLSTNSSLYAHAVDANGLVYPDRKEFGGVVANVQVVQG